MTYPGAGWQCQQRRDTSYEVHRSFIDNETSLQARAFWREPGEKGTTAMTMTDPIADMLTRIRNANSAYHEQVVMPFSKLKGNIAEILVKEGYVASWATKEATVGKSLVINLKFSPTREQSISGIRRVSKPGLRVYAGATKLPKVLGGLGVAIISTSHGLLTDRQANKQKVGGEVLAYVW